MRMPALLGFAIVTVAAACAPPPEFVASLSDPGEAAYDQRVLGQWYQQTDDLLVYAAFADAPATGDDGAGAAGGTVDEAGQTGKLLRISLIFQDGDGEDAASLPLTAFASRLDGALYYNFVRRQTPYAYDYTAPGGKPGHIVVRMFHPAPDVMLVCGFFLGDDMSDVEDALEGSGLSPRLARVPARINGRPVDPEDTLLHALVDGSRADLLRLVKRDPGNDFELMFAFSRLGTPWVDPLDDPGLRAFMRAHGDECNFDTLN
ncbi:MAG: hypothetical protein ACE5FS_09770 [Paracoccaceae bacterium]